MKTFYPLPLLIVMSVFLLHAQAQPPPGKKTGSAYPLVYTNLMVPYNNSLQLVDGVAAAFDNRFSAAVDSNDAIKMWNPGENIALVRDAYTLAIEFRPVPKRMDTLFFRLYLRQQPYTLQILSQHLPANIPGKAWLVDNYLETTTEVNLYDTTFYNFTPTTDTNSYRNRFMLVLSHQLSTNAIPAKKEVKQSALPSTAITNREAVVKESITIYPNPVNGNNKPALKFTGLVKGNYTVVIYSSEGREIMHWKITHNGIDSNYPLPVNALIPPGIYMLKVKDESSGKGINLKLLVND